MSVEDTLRQLVATRNQLAAWLAADPIAPMASPGSWDRALKRASMLSTVIDSMRADSARPSLRHRRDG